MSLAYVAFILPCQSLSPFVCPYHRKSPHFIPNLSPPKSNPARDLDYCQITHPASPLCTVQPKCSLKPSAPRSALIISALLLSLVISQPAYPKPSYSENTLARRYVVTDAKAVLRYALPLPAEGGGLEETVIRRVQGALEGIGVDLRARGISGVRAARRNLAKVEHLLQEGRLDILTDVRRELRKDAVAVLRNLEEAAGEMVTELALPSDNYALPPELAMAIGSIVDFGNQGAAARGYDRPVVEALRLRALDSVAELEEMMVSEKFPFRIPRRYDELPRLLGRAKVEITIKKANGNKFSDNLGKSLGETHTFMAVLDGYSAPITAGNFVDLANRGFYNGTKITAGEKDFFIQVGGEDENGSSGYVDPKSHTRRNLPMEVLIEGDRAPLYGLTMESAGVGNLQPVLPMTAYGAMSMSHSLEDDNDASSQFYVFLLDPRSRAARSVGGTVLNGNVATFGYITVDTELLSQVTPGDTIGYMKVVQGMDKFERGGS